VSGSDRDAFSQPPPDDLEMLADRAKHGDRSALEALVEALSDEVYRLAIRMLAHPSDAEDACQEILIKVVTHLGGFRGESSVRTWVRKVATNHLLTIRRSRREVPDLSFEALEGMLQAGLAAQGAEAPADPVLEEEVKLGCTHTMLLCLDREHRVAFVLAEVLDLTGEEGAAALGISAAAFRKRVSRARERLRQFMEANCGLVSEGAACRCRLQVGPSVASGLLDPDHLLYALHPERARVDPDTRQFYRSIEGARRWLAVLRSHPDYAAPDSLLRRIREALASSPSTD
jgi:RNA polymerase sigma factor (sigma-70 family)